MEYSKINHTQFESLTSDIFVIYAYGTIPETDFQLAPMKEKFKEPNLLQQGQVHAS